MEDLKLVYVVSRKNGARIIYDSMDSLIHDKSRLESNICNNICVLLVNLLTEHKFDNGRFFINNLSEINFELLEVLPIEFNNIIFAQN